VTTPSRMPAERATSASASRRRYRDDRRPMRDTRLTKQRDSLQEAVFPRTVGNPAVDAGGPTRLRPCGGARARTSQNPELVTTCQVVGGNSAIQWFMRDWRSPNVLLVAPAQLCGHPPAKHLVRRTFNKRAMTASAAGRRHEQARNSQHEWGRARWIRQARRIDHGKHVREHAIGLTVAASA